MYEFKSNQIYIIWTNNYNTCITNFEKKTLYARQSESKEWSNDDELYELQQCKFKDNCKWCWYVVRKQWYEIVMLMQW